MRLRTYAGFRLFWTASTVSDFGTPITTLAIQVLVVTTLSGSAVDVGLVNAARWLPYLLVRGRWSARWPTGPGASRCWSAAISAGPGCCARCRCWPGRGCCPLPVLAALVAVFGLLSLVNDAAHQSFLPRLLPREALTRANARLAQSSAAADTAGPAVAGGLVGWLGAPAAVLVDAGRTWRPLCSPPGSASSTRPRRPAPRCAGRSARAWPGCTGTGCCARCR